MYSKITAAALAISMSASTVQAGSMSDPVIEQDLVIAEATSSSSGTAFVAFFALVLAIPALSGGGGGGIFVSDERLKTDITRVGKSPSGLPIYTFRYAGDTVLYQGVMAQDVLKQKPDAVKTGAHGYMMVDYSKIDAKMVRVD